MQPAKKGLVGLGGGIVALLTLIALFSRPAPQPIPIGFVASLSGKAADLGIDCRRGTEIAVTRINADGGIRGRPITLVVEDDGNKPETAQKAVQTLLALHPPVIIGHATSAMSTATLPLINRTQTLLVSPTTSTPLLQGIDDNFIRSCTTSVVAPTLMAKYLREEQGFNRVGVVWDLSNKSYTEMWYKNFQKGFLKTAGGSVEGFTFTSVPDTQFIPLVTQMKTRGFDALVVIANSLDAAMLCQQVRKSGWQVQLALSDWSATEQLIELGGHSVEGAITSQFFNRKSTKPRFLQFKEDYRQAYRSEPGFGAMHSYNATTMVFEAMRQQRDDESLKETILRLAHFKGLQDDITIDQYGDSNHPTYIGVINNGTIDILEDFQ